MLHRIARALGFVSIASVPTLAAVELAEARLERAIERAREADELSSYWGREVVSMDARIAELERANKSRIRVLETITGYETQHASPAARRMARVAREGLAA